MNSACCIRQSCQLAPADAEWMPLQPLLLIELPIPQNWIQMPYEDAADTRWMLWETRSRALATMAKMRRESECHKLMYVTQTLAEHCHQQLGHACWMSLHYKWHRRRHQHQQLHCIVWDHKTSVAVFQSCVAWQDFEVECPSQLCSQDHQPILCLYLHICNVIQYTLFSAIQQEKSGTTRVFGFLQLWS